MRAFAVGVPDCASKNLVGMVITSQAALLRHCSASLATH